MHCVAQVLVPELNLNSSLRLQYATPTQQQIRPYNCMSHSLTINAAQSHQDLDVLLNVTNDNMDNSRMQIQVYYTAH